LDELMNIKEAASYLRLNYMTVYKLAQKRRIPAFKVGGNWRFKRDILDNWLNAQANTNMGSVLIVDDNPDIVDVLKEIVKDQHHDVETALDGKSALEIVNKKHFDLIFLDLLLPDISGTKVLESIKEKDKTATIVVITAVADEPVALKAMSMGPLMLIRKPFREKDIIDILTLIMKGKGTAR
jgi:excisionase family DNA binding protein